MERRELKGPPHAHRRSCMRSDTGGAAARRTRREMCGGRNGRSSRRPTRRHEQSGGREGEWLGDRRSIPRPHQPFWLKRWVGRVGSPPAGDERALYEGAQSWRDTLLHVLWMPPTATFFAVLRASRSLLPAPLPPPLCNRVFLPVCGRRSKAADCCLFVWWWRRSHTSFGQRRPRRRSARRLVGASWEGYLSSLAAPSWRCGDLPRPPPCGEALSAGRNVRFARSAASDADQ